MKYRANPVIVDALKIVRIDWKTDDGRHLKLENGDEVTATTEMLARIDPKVGDYWVIQSDGYVYLNPKDVFERKYSPVEEA